MPLVDIMREKFSLTMVGSLQKDKVSSLFKRTHLLKEIRLL